MPVFGGSVAENPTISNMPIEREEFSKWISTATVDPRGHGRINQPRQFRNRRQTPALARSDIRVDANDIGSHFRRDAPPLVDEWRMPAEVFQFSRYFGPRTSLNTVAKSRSARAPSPTKADPCIVAKVFGCNSASRWRVGSVSGVYGI